MTLILDATVGGATSNSYATVAEATDYHEGVIYSSAWFAATTSQRTVALVHATRLLDEQVEWYGTKATRTQRLRWPRSGVPEEDSGDAFYDPGYGYYTIPNNLIPQWLKNATAECARHMMIADRTAEPDMLEYTDISIGVLSLTKDPSQRKEVLPESVQAMIAPYGEIATSSGLSVMKLVRA